MNHLKFLLGVFVSVFSAAELVLLREKSTTNGGENLP